MYGMTPAEFVFQVIMERRGIAVTKINGVCLFTLHGYSYTPDFYDEANKIYYEVSGTRQAFHANKHKYLDFLKTHPELTLKIVKPDGTEIPLEATHAIP